jgi:catechol 2,3-dioxygenase-like lactoylglutathione lyase family enzyme
MAFHHVALACRDTEATHRFYTERMGFELVKTNVGKTPGGGWAKHFFYDTGGDGLIAFWEIHDDAEVRPDWRTDISRGLGLPPWVNHLAFEARSEADFDAARRRWLEHGLDVMEVDHGFCRSLYTADPNGITVEWCITTRPFDDAERREAGRALHDPHPEMDPEPEVVVHRAPRGDG